MTRVLVVTGVYAPEIGGPATHTALLEREFPKRGVTVDVLPFREVRHLPKLIRHFVFFWKVLRRARAVDLVFAQDTVSVGLPGGLAARLAGKPFVVRVPGDYAWEQASQRFGVTDTIDQFQKKRYGINTALLRFLQQRTVRLARAVVVPSNYFHGVVRGWGVRSERIHTIYNGITFDVEPRRPHHVPEGRIMISAGRMVPWKGFRMLIELLPELPEWHLILIGDGPEEEALTQHAASRNVTGRVTFTGALSREELLGWRTVADVFVFNSSFESFSYQVASTMAAGTPIITTNVGSIPELIENGTEGVLLEPDDKEAFKEAIESIIAEPDVWRARTEAARRKAELFSVERTTSALLKLFKNLAGDMIKKL
jgi:glycosyltransferase involved in cell wall biosynthesis